MIGEKRKTKDGKMVQIISYDGGTYTCMDLSSGNSLYIAESDLLPAGKTVVKKVASIVVDQHKEEFLQDEPIPFQPQQPMQELVDTMDEPQLEVIQEEVVQKPKKQRKPKTKPTPQEQPRSTETQRITPTYKDKYNELEDL